VSDAGLYFAFSIRVSDPARHGHDPVVRKHIAVERIERRIVDVGDEHALTQIVEYHHARAATKSAKRFLMELGPDLRTGTKDQQADRLAARTECHDEQPSPSVLAALLVAHHGAGAVIDLGLFSRCGQNDPYGLRRVTATQFTHKAFDRLIAGAIAVLIHQSLPDRHGIASSAQPELDGLAMGLADTGSDRGSGRFGWLIGQSRATRVGGHLIGRFCRSRIGGRFTGRG